MRRDSVVLSTVRSAFVEIMGFLWHRQIGGTIEGPIIEPDRWSMAVQYEIPLTLGTIVLSIGVERSFRTLQPCCGNPRWGRLLCKVNCRGRLRASRSIRGAEAGLRNLGTRGLAQEP